MLTFLLPERFHHRLSDREALLRKPLLLDEHMIDGGQRVIYQIEIEHRLRLDAVKRYSGEIERTAIALLPIRTLNHGAVERIAVHTTNQRPALVKETTPAF
jgi:hypothetical protein